MVNHDFDINKLDEIVNSGVVLLDFYADWCGPCKMLMPELNDLVKKIDVNVYKISVDMNPDIAKKYGIMTIPTLVLYKDGKIVNKHSGYRTSDDLVEWIRASE